VGLKYSNTLRSSEIRALGDDASKDDQTTAFLAELPLAEQAEWLTRLRWIRLADRLAENELIEPARRQFAAFRRDWREFAECGHVAGDYQDVWLEMGGGGCRDAIREPRFVTSFGDYLEALQDYTRADLEIATLADHDCMLRRLTGSFMCTLPYLPLGQQDAIAGFGMLDQMMNNLRDLAEDAAHGLSFFPHDVLARFGVEVEALLTGRAAGTPRYRALIRFWLDEHLPAVQAHAAEFLALDDLHPSLVAMRRSFSARYARIEHVFRACDFDYVAFPRAYWGDTRETPRRLVRAT
jgi:phytoene synthase